MDEQTEKEVGRRIQQNIQNYPDSSVLQLQLDMSDPINLIEHDLKGEWYDYKDQEWKRSGMRMMNDEGVRAIVSILHNYLTPNTFLSNFDDSDIRRIMEPFHRKLAAMIIDKQEEWEIEDAYMRMIVQKITDTLLFAMKRGLFHKTLDALTQSSRFYESKEVSPKKSGRGPLKWFS